MGKRWIAYGNQLCFFAILVVLLCIQDCSALNSEGSTLLQFRARVTYDPYGVFENWNINDHDPCRWSGVHCKDGRVQTLVLNGHSLGGELAEGIGNLSYLRSLVLYDNNFGGAIPKEIGGLVRLEEMDLRNNNFNGTIPAEIGQLRYLKRLLLCDNNFGGEGPVDLRKLNRLSELQFDDNLTFTVSAGVRCVNRKLGHCILQNRSKQFKESNSFDIPIKGTLLRYFNVLSLFGSERSTLHRHADKRCHNLGGAPAITSIDNKENPSNFIRRSLLQQSNNLAAAPVIAQPPLENIQSAPITRSSGSFPAFVSPTKKDPSVSPPIESPNGPDQSNNKQINDSNHVTGRRTWVYAALGASLVVVVVAAVFITCRARPVAAIGPWKTGISGQLQKAFVTGVPKLNRAELETACEDFSNIIATIEGCTFYKGTLSSGVEIAVGSTSISSVKDWSKRSELLYRKKIDMLSRVNHKNFVNLIGYCEEDEPFTRMMVFEYAPNGTLFDHLHVEDFEHLDWTARTRIIMGITYCLQHMHNLNPPVSHGNLDSNGIYLTDDYAAKIVDFVFWRELAMTSKSTEDKEFEYAEHPPLADPETNVYSFGLLLLEIISGKLLYSDEHGPLEKWASQFLNNKNNISQIVDPSLKSIKNNELEIICEIIRDCIQENEKKRPNMVEIATKLREVVAISPDAATPRLSPLWWAELEILSSEAA